MNEKERVRLEEMLAYQHRYVAAGIMAAGIDEVGRGPLAGPVVTACVIMPDDPLVGGIKDSKKITSEARREKIYAQILEHAVAWSVGSATVEEIDSLNILNATKLAMQRAIDGLSVRPDRLLIDAVRLDTDIPQVSIIKGDALCYSIAAASIVAKVTRDRIMNTLDEVYPQYGFVRNKGYGTAEHIAALKTLGATPVHRRTFIRNFVQ